MAEDVYEDPVLDDYNEFEADEPEALMGEEVGEDGAQPAERRHAPEPRAPQAEPEQ